MLRACLGRYTIRLRHYAKFTLRSAPCYCPFFYFAPFRKGGKNPPTSSSDSTSTHSQVILETMVNSLSKLATDAPFLLIHGLLSLIAFILLALAALQAIRIAIQEYRLHTKKNLTLEGNIPPLQTLEKTLFQILMWGFILLTLSLSSGFIYLNSQPTHPFTHKTIFAIAAWVLFALLLIGHHRYGWRGKTAAQWTLVGFVFLVISYFGTKFVLQVLL